MPSCFVSSVQYTVCNNSAVHYAVCSCSRLETLLILNGMVELFLLHNNTQHNTSTIIEEEQMDSNTEVLPANTLSEEDNNLALLLLPL